MLEFIYKYYSSENHNSGPGLDVLGVVVATEEIPDHAGVVSVSSLKCIIRIIKR